MANTSTYVHGTEPVEQERLALMNGILNASALRELNPQVGSRVLDLGAGTGLFARCMANAVGPTGCVLAVERSGEQVQAAMSAAAADDEAGLVDFRCGDAAAPPLEDSEWGSFDVVHARFLLEHLQNPKEVVDVMLRAARPGGRIVLADDDHAVMRMWPEPEGMLELWDLYARQYETVGNDPYVGRRLISLLHQSGAVRTRNSMVFFGGCADQEIFPTIVENLAGVVESARELILSSNEIQAAEFGQTLATFRRWGASDDASIWYPLAWAEGYRPED
ncbi:MAG: SAM-dependent methyltransferase [Chlamydiales bacterium]|jgi:SAM-dependent methyltransferase